MAADPTTTGERVLRGLDAGRRKHNEAAKSRAQALRIEVKRLADLDALEGRKEHGRAVRIRQKLRSKGFSVGVRHVRKILAHLFCGAD